MIARVAPRSATRWHRACRVRSETVVSLCSGTMTRLRERLFELAASGRPLVADLDQVSFIDSTGLAALVGTAKRATACGGSLYAVCGRPKIRQLFRITGLDRQILLASTLDEALEALA